MSLRQPTGVLPAILRVPIISEPGAAQSKGAYNM
jgi:hypothetical protein